eukprot:83225_1
MTQFSSKYPNIVRGMLSEFKNTYDPKKSKMDFLIHLSEPESINNTNCKYDFYGSYYLNNFNNHFDEYIKSLMISDAFNCDCNGHKCIHIHYKSKNDLFSHLLLTINYSNYQKLHLKS